LFLFTGCSNIVVTQRKVDQPKGMEAPQRPSTAFMKGYWDGYFGHTGVVKFTLREEYRKGNVLGKYDRDHGINQRYSFSEN
jgi:hypothetical protein